MALSGDLVYGTKAVSDLHRNQTVHVAELEGSQTRVGFSVTVADQARQQCPPYTRRKQSITAVR